MAARSSDTPDLLVDASVAIPAVVSDHEHDAATFAAMADRRLGLAGHAAFECFSVLTRLPPPARRTPPTVARLLAATFPQSRFLSERGAAALLVRLESLGLTGGSIYDALVGAAAAEHGITLATRDLRALQTYRALEVHVELLP